MMNASAAWKINGTVYSGRSHAEILRELDAAHKRGDIQHGYVDLAGNFYGSIEELLKSMKETIIIRHAETYYNINETENLDSNLTERGVRQAVGLATYLGDSGDADGFSGLVSPFVRTLETALAIHAATGVPFMVFPLVSEYGATWSKVPYHVFVPARQEQYPMFDWSLYQHGELFTAETFNQFLDRMRKVLESDLPEKTVIVSHGAVVYTLVDLLTGGGMLEEGYGQVTNASVTKLRGTTLDYLFKQEWNGD
jgi:broad specificity phosphatase PhoE